LKRNGLPNKPNNQCIQLMTELNQYYN